jgi:hypothetical protein
VAFCDFRHRLKAGFLVQNHYRIIIQSLEIITESLEKKTESLEIIRKSLAGLLGMLRLLGLLWLGLLSGVGHGDASLWDLFGWDAESYSIVKVQ